MKYRPSYHCFTHPVTPLIPPASVRADNPTPDEPPHGAGRLGPLGPITGGGVGFWIYSAGRARPRPLAEMARKKREGGLGTGLGSF